MSFPPSTVIHDYQIESEIGQGAFSVVYKVTRVSDKQVFAMKAIQKKLLEGSADKERLQREVDASAFLTHENVVSLKDFFEDDEHFFLILDYCQGGQLLTYIIQHNRLKEQQAASVFIQLLNAIKFCHDNGVVHRDLKPSNIFVETFPNIKVGDFGLCGFMEGAKMHTFVGSPSYAAPELLQQQQQPYDGQKSDIWSLGVILYEMVTGSHPWNVRNTAAMVKQIQKGQFTIPDFVSEACKDMINSMMKVRPGDRATISQLLVHPWLRLGNLKRRKSLQMTEAILAPQIVRPRSRTTQIVTIISPFKNAEMPAAVQRISRRIKSDNAIVRKSIGGLPPELPKLADPADDRCPLEVDGK